jgi:hypothetical protein
MMAVAVMAAAAVATFALVPPTLAAAATKRDAEWDRNGRNAAAQPSISHLRARRMESSLVHSFANSYSSMLKSNKHRDVPRNRALLL